MLSPQITDVDVKNSHIETHNWAYKFWLGVDWVSPTMGSQIPVDFLDQEVRTFESQLPTQLICA